MQYGYIKIPTLDNQRTYYIRRHYVTTRDISEIIAGSLNLHRKAPTGVLATATAISKAKSMYMESDAYNCLVNTVYYSQP